MAILEDLPGIEATVRVNGEPLFEYDDDEEYQPQDDDVPRHKRAKVTSHYIESATGAEFTIKISVGQPYKMKCPSLGFKVFIDGVCTNRGLVRNLEYLPQIGWRKECTGVSTRDVIRKTKRTQNFTFARLQTSMLAFLCTGSTRGLYVR